MRFEILFVDFFDPVKEKSQEWFRKHLFPPQFRSEYIKTAMPDKPLQLQSTGNCVEEVKKICEIT